jgi:hypothetical protein
MQLRPDTAALLPLQLQLALVLFEYAVGVMRS